MSRSLSTHAGTFVVGMAVVHTAVGLWLGAAPLAAIFRGGYMGAVDGHFDRMTVFWFLWFGFLLLLVGGAFRRMEQSKEGIPSGLGWLFGGLCLAGAVAMPVSGFWLGLIPAAIIVVRARRRQVGSAAAALP